MGRGYNYFPFMITFADFKKLDIRIGSIVSAEKIEGTDKLLKLVVDLGKEKRQLVAGVAQYYKARDLVGKQVPVVVNLKPRQIKGIESQGMILAADEAGKPVLLHPDKQVAAGSVVR